VEKGHRVTFFAAGFSHYKFEEIRLKGGENWRAEEYDGVRFIWIKTPPYKKNDWKRAFNMCSFAWKAYWTARKLPESPDVIIGTTFHPLASLSAYGVSVAKRKPFIFEVKDLWPLTMIQFGRLSPKSFVTRGLSRLERFLACRAVRIMTVLPGASEYFTRYGISKEQVIWIPNGLEMSRYAALRPYSGEISGSCRLVYAGGHVEAFALETVLLAAQIEQQSNRRTRFVFVGGGQEKPNLVQLARDLNLRNVEFRDAVPKTELFRVMEEADAFILCMQDLPELYRYGVSFNKLCDYVAAGRPVLFAGNPSNNVVKEFQCGIVVKPEDPGALAAAIREFEEMTAEQRAEMGRNGLRCARERFDIATLAARLESLLISVDDEFRGVGKSMPQPTERLEVCGH